MRRFLFCLPALLVFSLTQCASNEEFAERMEKRNEHYSNWDERRRIRLDARQERTDMWYDRVLGKSQADTGIRTGLE